VKYFARIDPVRILDLVGVEPVDLRPQIRVAEIGVGEIPQRIALLHGMRRGVGSDLLRP